MKPLLGKFSVKEPHGHREQPEEAAAAARDGGGEGRGGWWWKVNSQPRHPLCTTRVL